MESGSYFLRILITGVCGFVGSVLAKHLRNALPAVDIVGLDNLMRKGSERNVESLCSLGVTFVRGDLRCASDLAGLPATDWVIDAAAMPSILAGLSADSSSQQVVEHNLIGSLNLLEYCRRHASGLILLSTSRVYSIHALSQLALTESDVSFCVSQELRHPGISYRGIDESFSTSAPVSIYGATKLASETMAAEYGEAFGFPVFINRCGVLAGAGQFGRLDQGIFSYWINSHFNRKPLRYLGFQGNGKQVRDCLHPTDLAQLIVLQIQSNDRNKPRVCHVSGGVNSAISLKELTTWCDGRFGSHRVNSSNEVRPYDLPWVVLDASRAEQVWGWKPSISREEILNEIASHAVENPRWLEFTS